MAAASSLHAVHAIDPARAARYRQEGYWPDRLLTDYLDEHARADGARTAFIDSRGRIDYAQLQSASYRLADALRARGVQAGDVVAIQLPNWIEFAVVHLALVRLGAVTCLVTPISRERDVATMLRIASARWFVTADSFRGFDHLAMAAALAATPGLQPLQVVVVGPPGAPAARSGIGYAQLLAEGRDDAASRASIDALRPHPDALAEIVFTSGTTGEPKGVQHSHNTLLAPQLAMAERLRLRCGVVLHMASTVAHQTGFLNGIRLPVQVGGSAVLQDVWQPEAFARLIAQHRIEVSSGSPTFLLDLLRSPALDQHDASSLRIFRVGGGPIPTALVREAEQRLPGLTVVRGWGQTENGVVTMTRLDDPVEERAESDGSVQPGMEIRVVDRDGAPRPVGVEGHLQCRGASMCLGYANDPKLLRASSSGSWFDTGDLAVIVANDARRGPAIRITGRAKDIIIRGGENIPVGAVENALFEDPRIREAAIVGMPDERLGERACAFVICRPGCALDLEEMRRFLSLQGVARPYWPERLELVEALPRTANGKVNKASLRALLQERLKQRNPTTS